MESELTPVEALQLIRDRLKNGYMCPILVRASCLKVLERVKLPETVCTFKGDDQ